ncbi:hypothetical protein [Acinetobacter sp. YH16053]|uniref:hypothetical protein n=1 Tax=Acinetobacter sp. YH16053 TaxID=2601192 RepID=UPI0015D36BCB|nr:hypothetical protein [Acinetobacter sp. YH16053]
MQNTNKYDVHEALEMATLAKADMEWTFFMITDIKKRLKEVRAEMGGKNTIALYHLEQAVGLYQYVAQDRLGHHSDEAERLENECNHKEEK